MALDQAENFVRGDVDSSIASGDTTISVDDASAFPDPSTSDYNLTLWDPANHPVPDADPDVEIVRVTGRDTTNDNLTVTRGEENTSAAAHPKTSELLFTPTAKFRDDVQTEINGKADDPHGDAAHSVSYLSDGENFDGQSSSDFSNLNSVGTTNQATTGVSWSDVSGSRSFGTWFQAPADQDLRFVVGVQPDANGSDIQLRVHINDSQTDNRIYIEQWFGYDSADNAAMGEFTVPAGHYYKVADTNGNVSIFEWEELS